MSDEDAIHFGKWGDSNLSVERCLVKLLKKFDLSKKEVRICYEADTTYGLLKWVQREVETGATTKNVKNQSI